MAGLCIPKSVSDKLKVAFKSGDINIEKLYSMTDEDRNTVFSHYVGKDSASLVNAVYEKAKITAEKKAAADYITASQKDVFKQKATAGEFGKSLLNDEQSKKIAIAKVDEQIKQTQLRQKIASDNVLKLTGEDKANAQFKLNKLKDQEAQLNVRKGNLENPTSDRLLNKINKVKGLLGDGDYEDLVKIQMGQDVSPAEGKYIVQKATELQELAKGNPSSDFGATPEYINARNSLDHYIGNLEPTSPLSIVKNTIEVARNFLITGFSTPIKVLVNYLNHPAGIIIRRLSDLSLRGDNYTLTDALKKQDVEFTKSTGTSAAQMHSINDSSTVLGSSPGKSAFKNETFEEPSIGTAKGVMGAVEKGVAKVAQASHYVAITLEHTLAFNYVYRSTFYDILNLRATDFAKAEGASDVKMRATEIIKDAAKVEPQTDAGKELRTAAQAGAARITNTNDSYASRVSVGIKNGLNSISPSIPIGDIIEPMAKIPANVISNGIEDTPVGLPKALFDIVKGRMNLSADNTLETKYQGLVQYKAGVESAIRIFGSLGVASLITSQLTKKDFRSDQYGEHFILIGDVWVNTEYMARLNPDIAGLMAIKMNPQQNPIKEFATGNSLGQGSLGGLLNIPGIDPVSTTLTGLLGKNPTGYIEGAAESRVPSILRQMFETRPVNRILFGANGVETKEEVEADRIASAKKSAETRKENRVK